jgi:tRNA(adenine34) deaminase
LKYTDDKEKYMNEAYKEAIKASDKFEVPVGAVIVKDNKVISRAYNLRESKNTSLAHAELIAIDKACKRLKSWRLDGCEMYVTLEPCPMCAGAIIQSRISKVYIGAQDEKNGAVGSVTNMLNLNTTHTVEYENGILKEKCSEILSNFFKQLRKIKK